jgi:phosphatidylinositol alpha-mannosyltransferase
MYFDFRKNDVLFYPYSFCDRINHIKEIFMKIAIVCPYDYFRPGGVQFHIRDVAQALRARGHRVIVIAPPGEDESQQEDDLVYFGKRRSVVFNETQMDLSLVWGKEWQRLKKWMVTEAFDVIHFHTIWDPFLPLQILALAGNSACVATFHDTPPATFVGRVTKRIFYGVSRILYRWLDVVTAVSSSPARHLYKTTEKQIHIVPPCINYAPYFDIKDQREDNAVCTILFIGRLDPRKGMMVLLDAYKKLRDDGLSVELNVIGDGDQMVLLKQTISTQQIEGVNLIGRVNEEEKYIWMANADIFCSPALYGESFGIVLVEAMAAGLPVIAAANSGYSTVLQEQKETCLTAPGNSQDLYQKLKDLIKCPETQNRLSLWGKAEAKKHDCSTWVEKIIEIYDISITNRQQNR